MKKYTNILYILVTLFCVQPFLTAAQPDQITPPVNSNNNPPNLQLWQQGLLLALIPNVNNVVVRAVLPPIARTLAFIGSTINFCVRITQKGYNRLCRRPDPLNAEQIQIWENMVENITNTLCEQSISGTIMLKNRAFIAEVENDQEIEHGQWDFYVCFVSRMLNHIAGKLEQKISYYEPHSDQRMWAVSIAQAVSLQDCQAISFLIKVIADNLHHVVAACSQVQSPDDLNTEHIKKVSRNTLLLLKKLREMIGSNDRSDNQFGNQNFDAGVTVAGKTGVFV